VRRLQSSALALVAVLAAHTAFVVVWAVPTRNPIIFELRGIILKLSDIPFLLVVAVVAAGVIIRRQRPSRLEIPWYGLVAWMSLSVLWAGQPLLAAYQAGYTGLMLLMAAAFRHEKNTRQIVTVFAIASGFQGVLCMAQRINGGALGLDWLGEAAFTGSRAQGLTFNPNTAGSWLMLGVFAALDSGGRRGWTLAALSLGGLLATGSRAPLIALGVALSVYALRAGVWRAHLVRYGMLVAVALAVILTARNPDFSSMSDRLTYGYPGTLAVIQNAPLLGAGAGSLMIAVDQLAGVDQTWAHGFLQPAHNAYLALLAELGLPGLALFAAGAGLTLRRGRGLAGACWLALLLVMLLEYHFWLDARWRMMLLWVMGYAARDADGLRGANG
jgi:O-antigen ligase